MIGSPPKPTSIPPMPKIKNSDQLTRNKSALENNIRAIIESNFSEAKEANQEIAYHLIMEMIELYVRRRDDAIAD